MRAQSRLTFVILVILDKQWSSRRNGWTGNWNATLSMVSPGISDALLANILLWLLWAYGVWVGVCWGRWARSLTHKRRVRSPKSPRITPVLKQLVRERDILKTKAIQSKHHKDCYVFKKARNSMNSMRYTSQHGQREPIQVRIQKEWGEYSWPQDNKQKKNLASYQGFRGKWYPNNLTWNNMRIV